MVSKQHRRMSMYKDEYTKESNLAYTWSFPKSMCVRNYEYKLKYKNTYKWYVQLIKRTLQLFRNLSNLPVISSLVENKNTYNSL